ncbi:MULTISPECIES: MerR family transcriptional regulator [Bacillaceae]|uniref:Cobalamin-dependent protein n=1 Tax=Evansella alkalicola TaxID=745819 RepID=A0ABS6JZG4_9BACI|nr:MULTISPECIES: cobalamin-dependent protein [Bacillaceae]MBU9723981.1 cobalamin-dependent protein [Bacillus alkalicola]
MEGKYNIKAVSTMLGIQSGTLRAWERRYKIIEPKRNHVGHRLYTEEQVSILKWLLNKVNNGFTIGQAVGLLEQEGVENISTTESGDDQVVNLCQDLLTSLLNFDEGQCNQVLDRAFGLFSIDKVVSDVIGKVLVQIGDKWYNQEITIAEEHFASSYLRSRLGTVIQSIPNIGYMPKCVCVCTPGELHELGLLMFSIHLKQKGYDVIFLGSGIPKDDIEKVLLKVKPKVLFLSCTQHEKVASTLELASAVKDSNPDIQIGLGGRGMDAISVLEKVNHKDLYVGKTTEEWDLWLRKLTE